MLESVMLIDDNRHDNFFSEYAINESGLAQSVVKYQSAEKALEFLSGAAASGAAMPQLILLDINMPAMDGWEFLRKYEKLPRQAQENITIVMLTTSINPHDLERAKGEPALRGFLNKPLNEEMFADIVKTHFGKSNLQE